METRAGRMFRRWQAAYRASRAEQGEDLLEYGLLAALIAVVAMSAVTTFGNQIHTVLWQTIASNI